MPPLARRHQESQSLDIQSYLLRKGVWMVCFWAPNTEPQELFGCLKWWEKWKNSSVLREEGTIFQKVGRAEASLGMLTQVGS